MFSRQIVGLFFQVGDGQIVVRRCKVAMKLDGLQVRFNGIINPALQQLCIGQVGKCLDISEIKSGGPLKVLYGFVDIAALKFNKSDIAIAF